MTITNENAENLFPGNGLTTVFPTNIYALEADQIEVYIREDGLDTLQTPTTNYTLSGLGNPAGITITMLIAPAADEEVVVARVTPRTQELDLTSTRAYNPEALMTALDRIVMMMQEIAAEVTRSFKVKPGIDSPLEITAPDALLNLVDYATQATTAASQAAASAAAALAKENSMLRAKYAWLTATAYTPSDIVTFDGNAYICKLSHTSGVFATDLAANRWELFVAKGAAGAGTGDMLKTENLSGLTNVPLARSNLGATALGNGLFIGTATGGLTPGTNAQGQGQIAADALFVYTNAVFTTSGVTLPQAVAGATGREIEIVNNPGSTADINVYPTLGDTFALLSVNAPIAVAAGWRLIVRQQTTGVWTYKYIPQNVRTFTEERGRVQLQEVVPSGATSLIVNAFDFSKWESYELELENIRPVSNAVILCFRASNNGGSSFRSGGTDYTWSHPAVGGDADGDTLIRIAGTDALPIGTGGQDDGVSGIFRIVAAGKSGHRTRIFGTTGWGNTNAVRGLTVVGQVQTPEINNAFMMFFSAGAITASVGRVRLFGLK